MHLHVCIEHLCSLIPCPPHGNILDSHVNLRLQTHSWVNNIALVLNMDLMGTSKFVIIIHKWPFKCLNKPFCAMKTSTTNDYASITYHINYQTSKWNHKIQWCWSPLNIGKALWWLYTCPPYSTIVMWWQTLEVNLSFDMITPPKW